MNAPETESPFVSACAEYGVWILEYRSQGFEKPLYLLWFTDTDEDDTDKMLVFKKGQIFAVTEADQFLAQLQKHLPELRGFENLQPWTEAVKPLEMDLDIIYDPEKIKQEIRSENLSMEALEALVDYINLFGDYAEQNPANTKLQQAANSPQLKKVWSYYYENIFLPTFVDNKKADEVKRPKLSVDYPALYDAFKTLQTTFESCFRLVA